MRANSALNLLQDEEPCIVTTADGDEREARWSIAGWCFYYLDRGVPTVFRSDEIEEWRPASVRE